MKKYISPEYEVDLFTLHNIATEGTSSVEDGAENFEGNVVPF